MTIRKPRDPAHVAEMQARRVRQNSRVAGFTGTGLFDRKHTKLREYPSVRGELLRRGLANLVANSLTDRGRVIARMTGPERKAWNGKGRFRGGARNLDWKQLQADFLRNTPSALA